MTAAERKAHLAAAIIALRSTVDRFIAAAESDAKTARLKMLEISIEVAPAMEEVVKIATTRTSK